MFHFYSEIDKNNWQDAERPRRRQHPGRPPLSHGRPPGDRRLGRMGRRRIAPPTTRGKMWFAGARPPVPGRQLRAQGADHARAGRPGTRIRSTASGACSSTRPATSSSTGSCSRSSASTPRTRSATRSSRSAPSASTSPRNGAFTGGVRVVVNPHIVVKAEYLHNEEYGGITEFDNDVVTSSLVLCVLMIRQRLETKTEENMRFNNDSFRLSRSVACSSALHGCHETTTSRTTEWSQIKTLEPLKGGPPHNPFNNRGRGRGPGEARPDAVLRQGRGRGDHGRGAVGQRRRHPEGRLRELPRHAVLPDSHLTSPGALANNGLVPGLSHGRNYLGDQHRPDGEPRLERVDALGGPLRQSHGRARHDRLGHLGDADRAGALRLHEVQGRVQRRLPGRRSIRGSACRRPIRPTSTRRRAARSASARRPARSRRCRWTRRSPSTSSAPTWAAPSTPTRACC